LYYLKKSYINIIFYVFILETIINTISKNIINSVYLFLVDTYFNAGRLPRFLFISLLLSYVVLKLIFGNTQHVINKEEKKHILQTRTHMAVYIFY